MSDIAGQRRRLVDTLFPGGVPALWCPPVTHYRDDGTIDAARMAAHLSFMSLHVRGFLSPGSTGDGWEMDDAETLALTDWILRSRLPGSSLLLGVLRPTTEEMLRTMDAMRRIVERMTERSGIDALVAVGVRGFALCAERGGSLTQDEIEAGLSRLLDTGLPIALYQLPQVTENEVQPGTFARLAARYPNLIMVKDTSGQDRLALSAENEEGVFFVRGAEGDYARWLKTAGGVYNGFLLSSANTFPAALSHVVQAIGRGNMESARLASDCVSSIIREVFALVEPFPHGNAFANANKAIDHFNAHGTGAANLPPPMLHAGVRLPDEVIAKTGEILAQNGLLLERGYVEG